MVTFEYCEESGFIYSGSSEGVEIDTHKKEITIINELSSDAQDEFIYTLVSSLSGNFAYTHDDLRRLSFGDIAYFKMNGEIVVKNGKYLCPIAQTCGRVHPDGCEVDPWHK